MPEQTEYAEIVVAGRRFRDWKSVSVSRVVNDSETSFVFEAASPGESGQGGKRIRMGDRCDIVLGGVRVVSGEIFSRQPAFTDTQHGLQIGGSSLNGFLTEFTAPHAPGEFKGYGIEQLAKALAKPAGVDVVLRGNPEGADKPFPVFRVQLGESVFAAISRMARMRNLFITDDEQGRLVLFRNTGDEKAVAAIAEGRNIKAASAIFQNKFRFQRWDVQGSAPSNDRVWGNSATSVIGSAEDPTGRPGTTLTLMAEMPGDRKDMEMRAAHELAEMKGAEANVQIIVQGWRIETGKLWIQAVGETVDVYSPRLFENDRMLLAISSVTHRQDARGGTDTVLQLCLPGRLGGKDRVEVN